MNSEYANVPGDWLMTAKSIASFDDAAPMNVCFSSSEPVSVNQPATDDPE
jgi:hypothetical protein